MSEINEKEKTMFFLLLEYSSFITHRNARGQMHSISPYFERVNFEIHVKQQTFAH